ncbi:MAG: glycogen/starch/alpha-glucan phosphorylase [bacterium]|nr:glycogen/starch/alpha-glucan phosphorylase [Candidatus Sumerlaeota bacterium]
MAKQDANTDHKVKLFMDSILSHVKLSLGVEPGNLKPSEYFRAVSLATRDLLTEQKLATQARYEKQDTKRLYYLSMEFLIGRCLSNALHNLGIYDLCQRALTEMGVDLEEIRDSEPDAALGNGGLGRLAACFLDSLATLNMPGFGYGINYEYGLFQQTIVDGYQRERADNWQSQTTPWLIERMEEHCVVPIYGKIVWEKDRREGHDFPMWMDWNAIIGVPHDMFIPGYGGDSVNYLRLYSARAVQDLDMNCFNTGEYIEAVRGQILSETVTKVLYPSDSVEKGKELRLLQEYFLVACSMRDIMRHFQVNHRNLEDLPAKVAIQMNDTHPSLSVAELMRLLVDENDMPWEKAWDITQATLGYTNHTLLPEALEKWPVSLFEKTLPRHIQIICEINRRFLDRVITLWPEDPDRLSRMSLIEEGPVKQVRMAHLAIVGSHSINGVAELHTHLLKTALLPDFYEMWPERFNNKTNGVTQRRFLLKSNRPLSLLICETIGEEWITDLYQLRKLEPYASKHDFQDEFMKAKRANKERLASVIKHTAGMSVDPDSLFDIQAKRIHEYKRQLLAVMHIMCQYLAFVEDGIEPAAPRTHIFAGKAAPGYWAAKQIIKLINSVAEVVNNDPKVKGKMRIVFVPDYKVSLAEKIFPGADLSEQISTAGMEASGTGNMKFAMNGALTICTLDGANIELMQEVGKENMYIFGLTTEEIQRLRANNSYNSYDYYNRNPEIKRLMDSFCGTIFSPRNPGLFQWIFDSVMHQGDRYFHLADIESYNAAHANVDSDYIDKRVWARKAILNVSRIGRFSSDRTIIEYARDIWGISRC